MAYTRKNTSTNYINNRFMNAECKLTVAFDTIGGRWTTQILFCIHFGLNRFGLIKGRLPRISDQILGIRLVHLVENKLVIKKSVAGEKIYELSAKGKTLIPLLEQLTEWQTNQK